MLCELCATSISAFNKKLSPYVPAQNLRGNITYKNSPMSPGLINNNGPDLIKKSGNYIQQTIKKIAHYSVATDQVCEFDGYLFSLVCVSESVQYSLDKVILSWVTKKLEILLY